MMTRPLLLGTNLKMTQTARETAAFVGDLVRAVSPEPDTRLFVIPSFTSLPAATERRGDARLWIGAQNMFWAPEGAYTGEISAKMLTALGVDLVLLGHAERRGLFHETDQDLNKKVTAALEAGLRVLLCVGETGEERQYGVGEETVARQLKIALHGLAAEASSMLQIAYEPVWSIGAGGSPATPADVTPIAARVRATLDGVFGEAGAAVSLLYGGSVDPNNAAGFTALPEIDGLFVGRACWTVDGFRATLAAAQSGRTG